MIDLVKLCNAINMQTTAEEIIKLMIDVYEELESGNKAEDLNFDKKFEDQGFDSLDVIEYVMTIEKRLGIHIKDKVLNEMETPNDFLKLCLEECGYKHINLYGNENTIN